MFSLKRRRPVSPAAPSPGRGRRSLRPLPLLAALVAAVSFAPSCANKGIQRYDRTQLEQSLANPEDSGLLRIGSFPLVKVIDGDTLKVAGLDQTLRLLAIDTEETFKKEKERRAFELGWETYLSEAEAKSRGPVKIPTPLGEDAKDYAVEFFKGVKTVHLERDHPKEIRGRFNRFLTYVFIERDGQRINYNLESVRDGMSPYFTKYGYSRRFHHEFAAAQAEARAAGRGIWDPARMHYTDYDARIAWWNARAEAIAAFEAKAEGRDDHVVLTHFDAEDRLQALLGREVVIFATIADIRESKSGLTKVLLSRRMFNDFPVVFFDREVFAATGLREHKGEHVEVRGVLTAWHNPYKDRDELQIEVKLAGQVKLSPVVRPGRGPAGATGSSATSVDAPRAPEAAPGPPSTPGQSQSQSQILRPQGVDDDDDDTTTTTTTTKDAPDDRTDREGAAGDRPWRRQ